MGIDKIEQDILKVLRRIGLEESVSLEEIEKEISKVDTVFQSLLVLGMMRRIMHLDDREAMEIFLPAITELKNYLPHPELGGLSPKEIMEKYPSGPYELRFISELLQSYQKRLEIEPDEPFDIEADFEKFQEEFLNRTPLEQPFIEHNGKPMTVREIIIEERRRMGYPEELINKIGIKIFVENTPEGAGAKMAEIEDKYVEMLEELERMKENLRLRNRARAREIRKELEKYEPYYRCGPAPHQFYLNYASVVLLDGGHLDLVISLLDKSLSFKPDYKPALIIKRNLEELS
jgi:hypothetical protein